MCVACMDYHLQVVKVALQKNYAHCTVDSVEKNYAHCTVDSQIQLPVMSVPM